MLCKLKYQNPDVEIHTDASGSWGCAAVWDRHWFQLQWAETPVFASTSIAGKELLPILIAAGTWGRQWRGLTVLCHSDNEGVVSVINTGSCREPHLAHLLRCLFYIEARFNFSMVARHIPGYKNIEADILPRNGATLFLSSHPQADQSPTPLNQSLVQSLVVITPDWMSPSWIKSFSTSCSNL